MLIGCSAATANGPLTVALGTPRDKTVSSLKGSDYCRREGPPQVIENYPRCDSPGFQLGESWVVARYNKNGRLDRLTRYERQPDEKHATDRWGALVKAARREFGEESKEARIRLAEISEPPDGAVAWVAWFSPDASAITALYLVRPPTSSDPNVVEEVRWAVTSE